MTMFNIPLVLTLLWALIFPIAISSTASSPVEVSVHTRNLPGHSDEDTYLALRRRFAAVARLGTFVANSSATLDTSWEDAPLFTFADTIHVSCTKCYVKGTASVQLTISDNDFNLTSAVDSVEAQVSEEIKNLTTTALTAAKEFVGNLTQGFDKPNFNGFAIDADFDIDMPPLPECQLKFTFDGLELYLQLGITLEGTFSIPIYRSQTPLGISIGDEFEMGAFLTVDLVLSADSGLEMETGFHIQFEDGIVFDIAMFSKNVSSVAFHSNGASFEFLPVTVSINDITLKAVLRVGIHAGFSIDTPEIDLVPGVDFDFLPEFSVGAGVGVGVFAHVAELLTNISPPGSQNKQDPDPDCKLAVRQEYTLAVGAAAGATVHLLDNTWGPQVATTTPIFYTTLLDACAVSTSSSALPTTSATATATLAGRQNLLETTTTTTEVKYTGVECLETGRINCPLSLQRTIVEEVTVTLSTAVPSGEDVDWDVVATAAVSGSAGAADKTVEFGAAAKQFGSTSGLPTSYVPPSETNPGSPGFGNPDAGSLGGNGGEGGGGLSTTEKIIIGVCVGVGVPLLVGLAVGVWCWRRKKTQGHGGSGTGVVTVVGEDNSSGSSSQQQMGYNKPTGNTTVYSGR